MAEVFANDKSSLHGFVSFDNTTGIFLTGRVHARLGHQRIRANLTVPTAARAALSEWLSASEANVRAETSSESAAPNGGWEYTETACYSKKCWKRRPFRLSSKVIKCKRLQDIIGLAKRMNRNTHFAN